VVRYEWCGECPPCLERLFLRPLVWQYSSLFPHLIVGTFLAGLSEAKRVSGKRSALSETDYPFEAVHLAFLRYFILPPLSGAYQ